MLFNKILFGFFSLSLILAHPLMERREDNNGIVLARAMKFPSKAVGRVIQKPPSKTRARPPIKPPAKARARAPPKVLAKAHPKAPSNTKPIAKVVPKPPAKARAKAALKPPARTPPKGSAKTPPKAPANKGGSKALPKVVPYTGDSYVEQARKANSAPGRQIPKACKRPNDCSCPQTPDSSGIQSTSCIKGFCACNDPGINFLGKETMNAIKAIGDAPVVQGIGTVMKVMSDVKQAAGTVVGSFLGPVAKTALKAALNVIPDTGPSHIDDATKGVFGKLTKI